MWFPLGLVEPPVPLVASSPVAVSTLHEASAWSETLHAQFVEDIRQTTPTPVESTLLISQIDPSTTFSAPSGGGPDPNPPGPGPIPPNLSPSPNPSEPSPLGNGGTSIISVGSVQGSLPPLAPALVDLAVVGSMLPEATFPLAQPPPVDPELVSGNAPSTTEGDFTSEPPEEHTSELRLSDGPDVSDPSTGPAGWANLEIAPAEMEDCESQLGQVQATAPNQRTQSIFDGLIGCYGQNLTTARSLNSVDWQIYAHNNLAVAHFVVGDYLQAIEHHEQQLALAQSSQNATQQGIALSGLGAAYGALGDYDEAIKHYTQGLRLIETVAAPQWRSLTLRNLGNAYYAQKDYEKALRYQENGLNLSTQTGDRYGEMQALGNLGNTYSVLGKFSQALEAYRKSLTLAQALQNSLEMAQALLGLGTVHAYQQDYSQALDYYQQSLPLVKTVGSRLGEGLALTNLGDALLQLGRLPEAEANLLAGVEVWESLRAGLGTNDSFKVSLFETQLTAYRNLQEVLIAQNQPLPALEIAERGRARAFVELLARGDEQAKDKAAPPKIEQIRQVAIAAQATLVEYTIIRSQFAETPHGSSVQYTTHPQDKALYIWVVKPTGEVVFRQVNLNQSGVDSPLAEQITALRDHVGIRIRGGLELAGNPPSRRLSPEHLQSLHQLLIDPIADSLPKNPADPVIFVPQEQLFLVPFPALQNTAGNHLVEQHTILSAPSIQVLELARARRKSESMPGNSLIVGNPTPLPVPLAALPYAETEALDIAQMLSEGAILGSAATETTIKRALPTAPIIHFATHGIFDEVNPLQSSLALALTNDQQDGLLTAKEVRTLSLNADLVVLSACDTGLGRITGDGVIGLSRSFIAAGANNVLVSLWQVPDQATADLMVEFYRQRQQSTSNAQALRQAMLKIMQTHPDPADWSAFTFIGDVE